MAEVKAEKATRTRRLRHKGRSSQVLIYLGKQLRFFINENDWKVLPMAAVIAALVSMVIRQRFFVNMEGSLMGAFALTCVAIWNGCFNSIQAVCRERAIIKREHRSGMHISSYVFAHMIYQLLLCTAQTGLTMYVLRIMDVPIPAEGFMTQWMIVDIGISMLLISYASDMLSLFISSISHTTTGAMTIMPFMLIFQLVFSGGIIPLPAWCKPLSNFTISNYGIQVLTAQSGYNEQPMVTPWTILEGMQDEEISGTFTVGQALDLVDNPVLNSRREQVLIPSFSVRETAEIVKSLAASMDLDKIPIGEAGFTLGDAFGMLNTDKLIETEGDRVLNMPVTLGQFQDFLKTNSYLQSHRDQAFTVRVTLRELFDILGKDNVRTLIQQRTAAVSRNPLYERSFRNIIDNWLMLGAFILFFAFLSTLALELIDKDKR